MHRLHEHDNNHIIFDVFYQNILLKLKCFQEGIYANICNATENSKYGKFVYTAAALESTTMQVT